MAKKVELRIPINRVEGDLDIEVTIEDGVITEAKSIGTLYRGFENILKGRDPLDALVITPRVCGICSISHLSAAVKALEDAYDITPPPQAVRLRNISVICENAQSDIKQFFLMFMADFADDYYKDAPFYTLAKEQYAPFRGTISKKALDATKDILKVIAYIGGQWPHTSHMVPGGLGVLSDDLEVFRIRHLIVKFKLWYEQVVLCSSLSEFMSIDSFEMLKTFNQKHPDSQVAVFTDIAEQTGLFTLGTTSYGFLNFPTLENENNKPSIPACYVKDEIEPLNIESITEDLTYAYYSGKTANPLHGTTKPDVNKEKAYSFTKAPRYEGKVVQTGPLGEELALKNKLFIDLYEKFGDSVFVREFARLARVGRYLKLLEKEIEGVLTNRKEPIYVKPAIKANTSGIGLTHAARGALGHWVNIKEGKIDSYQIISPTTWNGSPKDANNQRGAWEEALIGVKIKDTSNPMEMGHVIRSFDPCLVCTVHFIGDENQTIRLKV